MRVYRWTRRRKVIRFRSICSKEKKTFLFPTFFSLSPFPLKRRIEEPLHPHGIFFLGDKDKVPNSIMINQKWSGKRKRTHNHLWYPGHLSNIIFEIGLGSWSVEDRGIIIKREKKMGWWYFLSHYETTNGREQKLTIRMNEEDYRSLYTIFFLLLLNGNSIDIFW